MYDINSDEELNGDFRLVDHDNYSGIDNEEHISRAKRRPIKKKNKNKQSSTTVNVTFLKEIHNKETNK